MGLPFYTQSLLAVILAAACSCSEEAPAIDRCALELPALDIPQWNVERVFDLPLRDYENDPNYVVGTHFLSGDSEGVTVFTRSGFIRTDLDGNVTIRKPYDEFGGGPRTIKINDDYLAIGNAADYPDSSSVLCTVTKEGVVAGECVPWGKRVTWSDPYYYTTQTDREAQLVKMTAWNADHQQVETRTILTINGQGGHFLYRLGGQLLLETGWWDEDDCPTSSTSLVPQEGVSTSLLAHALPPGYSYDKARHIVEGESITLITYQASCHAEGSEACSPVGAPTLTATAVYTEGNGTPEIKLTQKALGSHLIWDGERFVGLSVGNGEYRLRFMDTEGSFIGEVEWDIISNVDISTVGDIGFAAIAPGDYVITFSLPIPDNHDRIVRVKVTP